MATAASWLASAPRLASFGLMAAATARLEVLALTSAPRILALRVM